MSRLQHYTAEEISTLHLIPLWVFYAVAGADSVIDQREISTFKRMLKEAENLTDSFAREVFTALQLHFDEAVLRSKSEEPIAGIQKTMEVVSRKSSPSECEDFKLLVFVIGWSVAAASGDLTDTGEGSNISQEEIENLTQIAEALSLSTAKLSRVITSSDGAKIWNSFLQ
jgi:uncharacterized tellurite resistance protein B-like protein